MGILIQPQQLPLHKGSLKTTSSPPSVCVAWRIEVATPPYVEDYTIAANQDWTILPGSNASDDWK